MQKKIKGRILSAVSAAALAVTALGSFSAALPAGAEGLTGLDAKGITSKMVIGWNLGNTLDCGNTGLSSTAAPKKFATAWGNPEPTELQFQALKDGGFNTVRIPTTWYEHLEWDADSQMYLVNDQWMDYVKQTVDYAYDRDMFVILNIHHENFINVKQFTEETYEDASKKMNDIWTQVAEEFKDYDQHLIFEGMNEPRQTANPSVQQWGDGSGDNGYSWGYVNRLNKVFVDAVRGNGSAANKERLLMLPGYVASSSENAIRNIEIPAGAGNVALSVHAYAPYYFTMATDSNANHNFPGKSGWGEDYEYALETMFNMLNQVQNDKGAPIIIGEFSASDFGNTEDRCRWATSYLSKAKNAGIPCVLWDNNVINVSDGEAHGYLYRLNGTWYDCSKPVIQTMMDVYGVNATLPDYQEVTEPKFGWDNIPVEDNWVELYKSEAGDEVDVWDNFTVPGWKDYVNEYYDLVLFYESKKAPELVLQGTGKDSWNRIAASEESELPYMKTFTFADVKEGLKEGEELSDMQNLFISATQSKMTAYALYAVPKGDVPQPASLGDVNGDGAVTVLDIITLQKYLLLVQTEIDSDQADMNEDGVIDVFDLALLKRMVLASR
ncbi:MAG: cellulase family glycosylhydrolase [Oscillospiraceae bacterium]|nr:cellulase family glycosylhydrolase [Oscillospiraceae bacterium]